MQFFTNITEVCAYTSNTVMSCGGSKKKAERH